MSKPAHYLVIVSNPENQDDAISVGYTAYASALDVYLKLERDCVGVAFYCARLYGVNNGTRHLLRECENRE